MIINSSIDREQIHQDVVYSDNFNRAVSDATNNAGILKRPLF